jgi:hypothetical protein
MDKRDSLLFGQYLDDENLLAWIRQSLTGGSGGSEGGPWTEDKRQPPIRRKGPRRKHDNAPTLEDVLRGWLRNRAVFAEIGEILNIHDTRPSKISSASTMLSFKKSVRMIQASLGEALMP